MLNCVGYLNICHARASLFTELHPLKYLSHEEAAHTLAFISFKLNIPSSCDLLNSEKASASSCHKICYITEMFVCYLSEYPVETLNTLKHISLVWLKAIRKTCPSNVYPLKPHFYIVKLGFAGMYLVFYTPGIYADGYIVFVFPFVRSLVRLFVR